MKSQLNDLPVIKTAISEGRYSIDGTFYSVEDFCRKAYDLDSNIMRPRPDVGVGIQAIDSREAAQVLRNAGHIVGNASGPIMQL